MWARVLILELSTIIALALANFFIRSRKGNNQYDLTAAILILCLIWGSHAITIYLFPVFHLVGKTLSRDVYFYDEAVAIGYLFQTIIACVIVFITSSCILKTHVRSFFDSKRLFHQLLTGFVVSGIMLFALFLVSSLRTNYEYRIGDLSPSKASSFSLSIIIMVIVVTSPIIEEIMMRGFLFLSVERSIGKVLAVIVSALAWALFHPDQNITGNIVYGIILGWLFLRTRSLIAPIMFHLSHNLLYILKWLTIL